MTLISEKKYYGIIIRIYSSITVADKQCIDVMIEKDLLVILSKMLNYGNSSFLSYIIWTLCNMLGENEDYKTLFYTGGLYDMVLREYKNAPKNVELRRVLSWLISNSLKGKPLLNDSFVS